MRHGLQSSLQRRRLQRLHAAPCGMSVLEPRPRHVRRCLLSRGGHLVCFVTERLALQEGAGLGLGLHA